MSWIRPCQNNGFPSSSRTKRALSWNHGIGETVTALLDRGFEVTGLTEHRSVPWDALPGRMVVDETGEWRMREHPERLPLSYTLRARKPAA